MSHFINTRAAGYQDLPDYPLEAPDPSVRIVEPPPSSISSDTKFDLGADLLESKKKKGNKGRSFYSESEEESEKSGSESESGTESGSGSSGSGTEDSESDSEESESGSEESGSESSDEGSDQRDMPKKETDKATSNGLTETKKTRKVVRYKRKETTSHSEDASSDEEQSQSGSGTESDEEETKTTGATATTNHTKGLEVDPKKGKNAVNSGDGDAGANLLVDLNEGNDVSKHNNVTTDESAATSATATTADTNDNSSDKKVFIYNYKNVHI